MLDARPDLAARLPGILDDVGEPRNTMEVEGKRLSGGAGGRLLEFAVCAAYDLSGRVRELIGENGPALQPVQPDTHPDYLEAGLLDHLR